MKKQTKLLALLLCLAMVASFITVPAASAADANPWSNYADIAGFTGSGTAFSVTSEAGLAYFAAQVDAGTDYTGATITLTTDLDLSAHLWDPIGWYPPQGSPTGTPEIAFKGTFNGGNHYITGMTIDGTDYTSSSGANNEGNALFSVVGAGGSVSNVGLTAVSVNGYRRSAAIAGVNHGTISNCMSTGTILANGGGSNRGSGGIVGTNFGTVQFCYSNAQIHNQFRRAGGIVGYNETTGTVTSCFFTGFAKSGFPVSANGFSGSIACTNDGKIEKSYYLTGSANDAQTFGCPAGYAGNSSAYEFGTDGKLSIGGGDMLTALNGTGSNFKSGTPYPVLAWESTPVTYLDVRETPTTTIPPAPAVTIKSTQELFADISVTFAQLSAKTTTPATEYTRWNASHSSITMTYSSVTGITLADIVTELGIPDPTNVASVNMAAPDGFNTTFDLSNAAHASAMLLWSAKDKATGDAETITSGLRSALDNGVGNTWVSNVVTLNIAYKTNTVTFDTTPATATVKVIRDGTTATIAPTIAGGKTYELVTGVKYNYSVENAGYSTKTGSVTPSVNATETVVLTTSGGGGSTTVHNVNIGAMTNGTVTANPTSATAGTKITLTVSPANNYALATLSVIGSTPDQTVSSILNTYTFTMPDADVTVNATFKAVALTVNVQQGKNGTPVKTAVFSEADLDAIASKAVKYAYMYRSNDAWKAVVTTEMVTLDALFGVAGVGGSYWKSGSYLAFTVSANNAAGREVYDKSYPTYNDISTSTNYFGDSTTSVVPAGIAIVQNSGDLAAPPGRDASVNTLAASASKQSLRFVYGVSQSGYDGPSYAAGARSPFQVLEITVVYGDSSAPTGSVGTTHGGNSATGTGDDADDDNKDDDNTDNTPDGNSTPAGSFKDIKPTDWYYNAVNFVLENNLFRGTSESSFSPDTNMTRAMLVTVLHRLAGEPEVEGESVFNDVTSPADYFYNAVVWATQNGVLTGYDDGSFGANDNVTREQMVTILFRYAKEMGYDVTATDALANFEDANRISDWALDAMRWAVAVGLINGTDAHTISPDGAATRAQVATILQRFVENVVK